MLASPQMRLTVQRRKGQRKDQAMQAIQVENPGKDYRLTLGEIARPTPGKNEVLIRVAAAGVNHADMLQARGHYPPPPGASATLGMEVSGEIAELGEGVTGLAKGMRVCALLTGGGYAAFAVASAFCVLPVPEAVDPVDATALPEAFFTVWTNLMDSARLKPGETVLVHGGSSGIGTAAIQLCTARGHKVFSTAASAEKCAAIEDLGAQAINYNEKDFVAVVKEATGGRGVDVILDMVGGDYVQRNMSAAALRGRIVNIAYLKGAAVTVNFAPMLAKRLSLLATTLRGREPAEKGVIRDTLAREVWPLLATGRIKPMVDNRFPLAEAQAAHARMASGGHIGKILLTL
jgi:putative PIG3 family NAD(P)H quinone oxidoreductase